MAFMHLLIWNANFRHMRQQLAPLSETIQCSAHRVYTNIYLTFTLVSQHDMYSLWSIQDYVGGGNISYHASSSAWHASPKDVVLPLKVGSGYPNFVTHLHGTGLPLEPHL